MRLKAVISLLFCSLFLFPENAFSHLIPEKICRGAKEIGYFRLGLTMVRGHIFAYHDGVKVPVTLKVVESRTRSEEELVYSPDTVEGSFFMFLPPANTYELWINTDGFEPYKMPLYIPNDTYLYEINQDIHFKSIHLLGNRIGQNVELKNTHYNLVYFKDRSEEDRTQIGYDFLLSFVDYTFNFGDTSRLKTEEFEKIEQVMNTPIFTDNSAEEAAEIDSSYDNLLSSIENIFANPELKKIEEIERIIKKNDGKCFFEAEKERQGNSRFADINAAQSGAKIIYKHRIIFSKNTKKLSDAQKKQLEEIAEMLNANDELLLNIVGYTYESDAFKPAKGFSDTRKFTKKVFRFLDKRISDVRKFALIASGMSKNLTPQENADDAEGSGKISKIEIVIIQE